jgi:type III secretion protein J
MTAPSARLKLALTTALLFGAGCTVELQHDLEEDDANDIYVLLTKKNIDAQKIREEGGNEPRYIIKVAKKDVADAAELLREYSLPRPKAEGLGTFRKNKGMIPTQTEERAMLLEAIGGEVANALNRWPGVLEARTIVMIPEVNDLTQPDKKPLPSASVLVKYRLREDGKAPLTEDQVKSFVATTVSEMKKENVTVLMTEASLPVQDADESSRMQTVLGLRMAKASADQFKIMVAAAGLVILVMAGLTAFNFMRGGASAAAAKARREASDE